jgi:hypothetical protein
MALIADVDNLDLVVEPREFTAEDREAFRRAVEERRNPQADTLLSQRAAELLAQRHRGRPAPSQPNAAGNGERESE